MDAEDLGGMIIVGIILIAIIIVPAWLLFTANVDAGNVGILTTFGYVEPYTLQSGFHFKSPVSGLHQMSMRTQAYTMSIASEESTSKSGDDTISTLTKEGLSIDMDITILYHLEQDKAMDVYKNVGENYAEVIVRPQARSVLRNVVASYSADEIYSPERASIEQLILVGLQNMTKGRGIVVESVLLRNVKLPQQLNDAIQAKLTAQQQIQQKQFQVEVEKQEAERKRQEAQGISDSNKIISGSLTQNYLEWYWIESLRHQNASVIYVPTGETGMPLFKAVA
jgi:regulator of protease activity HflC (stomatin/prohibitin superfamily)